MLLLQKTTDDTWIQKFGSIAHWNFSSQEGTKFNFRLEARFEPRTTIL